MNEIKEETEIEESVSSKSNSNSNYIKDLNFSINTLELGMGDYTTEVINGKLDAIILESSHPVQVYITFADKEPEIVLFDSYDLPVTSPLYLPLRVQTIDSKNRQFTQSSVKWSLNDRIKCHVEGQKHAIVKVTIRYT